MRDYTNDWLRVASSQSEIRERLTCKDGFTMSLQASQYHYSSPRETGAPFYSAVEIGYPQAPDGSERRLRTLREYNDGWSVYGYVPIDKVNRIIHRHGGLRR